MKVFMTGASGYVGGVVASHLREAGHEVSALCRSDESAAQFDHLGVDPIAGDLSRLDVLKESAAGADAVVHAAVDFAEPDMRSVEEPALDALLAGLDGGRGLVYASTAMLYPDGVGEPDEEATLDRESPQFFKALGEQQSLEGEAVTTTVLRAALVYGHAGSALLGAMIGAAKAHRAAPYVGTGANLWSTVHVDDLAALYVAAVEKPTQGVFNAASRTQVSAKELADAVAESVGLSGAPPLALHAAVEAFGPFASILSRQITVDPSRAEQTFAWSTRGVELIEDLTNGSYRAG